MRRTPHLHLPVPHTPDGHPMTAQHLGPSAWRDDGMPATKETLMDEPAPTLHRFEAGPAEDGFLTGAYVSMSAEKVAEWLRERGYDVAPRAPQAATAANGAGDDAGAAHDPQRAAAGHTGARLREIFDAAFDATPTGSRWDEAVDAGIAAVIPAIRAAAIADHYAELTARANAAQAENRARHQRIARGDQ